jgi:hypothetical protein
MALPEASCSWAGSRAGVAAWASRGAAMARLVQKNRALSREVRIFTGGYRMKSGMKIACANWRTL